MYRPPDFVLSKERIRPPKKEKGKMSFLEITTKSHQKTESKIFGIASLPYMIDSETISISWVFQVSKLYQHTSTVFSYDQLSC